MDHSRWLDGRLRTSVLFTALTMACASTTVVANKYGLPPAGPGQIQIIYDAKNWVAPDGSQAWGGMFIDWGGTINGVPLYTIPSNDPLFENFPPGYFEYFPEEGDVTVDENGELHIDVSAGNVLIALSDKCNELLGYVHPGNQAEWVGCLALLAHELNHLQFELWQFSEFKKKAEMGAAVGGADVVEIWNNLINNYEAWDECMRSGGIGSDPPPQEDDEPSTNPANEAWTYYRTANCLCEQACELPDSPLRNKLLEQAAYSYGRAAEEWGKAEELYDLHESSGWTEGCPKSPCGLPPTSDPPPPGGGFEETGPTGSECLCDTIGQAEHCDDLETDLGG